ncbi:glycerophosphodiester phosphodiesterase [Nioella aestuarii]|uniref:glycerophosphodiester phosphodiesterase n=1 Tax=Nioella aestuarii TaxID=1662864 RepID=UPI003D7F56A3
MIRVLLAALLILPHICLAQISIEDRLADGQTPMIIAHRALGGDFPENSLAGIRYAIERGIDAVEIDVQITADGQYIVFHDPTLNRMTNVESVFEVGPPAGPTREQRGGRDFVADYTLEEIQRLRLLENGVPGDHPIPTLREALDLIEGRLLVILDLKASDLGGFPAHLEGRDTRQFLVFSSDPEIMLEMAEATGAGIYASLRRSRSLESGDAFANLETQAGILGPHLSLASTESRQVTPELLARAVELGVGISVLGTGREDFYLGEGDLSVWQDTLQNGAVAFMTSFPDEVLQLLDR